MGLDMYLSRKKFVGAKYEHRHVTGEIKINIGDKQLPIDFNKVSYVEEEVGYWRKANQIHNWFVENCQDGVDNCQETYVSTGQLKELLDICKEVKEKAIINEDDKTIENTEEIEDLLPTTSGFFFGSTGYDEGYMYDIDNTIEILETALNEEKELNKNGIYCDYYYRSSW
jgi:hypothetical protein